MVENVPEDHKRSRELFDYDSVIFEMEINNRINENNLKQKHERITLAQKKQLPCGQQRFLAQSLHYILSCLKHVCQLCC